MCDCYYSIASGLVLRGTGYGTVGTKEGATPPIGPVQRRTQPTPSVLLVELPAGLQGEFTGQFGVQWTTGGDSTFHYTEEDLDFRWGYHPHGGDYAVQGDAHFHPPPNASSHPNDVAPSCCTVHRPTLVTRGVVKNWHAAYHDGIGELNRPAYTG